MNPFRKFLSDQIAAINGVLTGGTVAPEIKSAFEAIRDQFQTQLNALPAEGGGSDEMMKVLGLQSATIEALRTTLCSVVGAVDARWNASVAAGDLIPKDKHAALCSEAAEAARGAGVAEGKNAAKADYEAMLAAERASMERKQEVARNGMPLPPDDVLKLADDEWKARMTEAQNRVKQVEEAGIKKDLPFVGRYAWAPEEDARALAEIIKLVPKGTGPNPLQGGGGGGGSGGDGATIKFSF